MQTSEEFLFFLAQKLFETFCSLFPLVRDSFNELPLHSVANMIESGVAAVLRCET